MVAYKLINGMSYGHSMDIEHLSEFCFIWYLVTWLENFVLDLV